MKPAPFAKKLAKLALNSVQGSWVAAGRRTGFIDFPVPPNSLMRKTSSRSIRHYYTSGLRSYLPIAVTALREGVPLRSGARVLDFGCGAGRQLVHFTRDYPAANYFACDIDDTSIGYIRRAFPEVDAYVNRFDPPLAYREAQFDLVYSVSIFSHLDLDDQCRWLQELARVTRPGGLCLLTTEGYKAVAPVAAELGVPAEEIRAALDLRGSFYQEYDDLREQVADQDRLRVTSRFRGVERSYGSAVLSPQFIRSEWTGAGLDVVDVVEGVIDNRQDLVILRRKD